MKLIDGKQISANLRENIKKDVDNLKQLDIIPSLAVIIVGEDCASKVYVKNKHKACLDVGINSIDYKLPETATQQELLKLIDSLNNDEKINGILVQLPLPSHIDEQKIINSINVDKDVDCFHPENVGKISIGNYNFLPCTPAGCIELIKSTDVDLSGKNCVVVGRSNIVGKPMTMLLLQQDATVTVCHSKTENLSEITKNADVLVVAIGKSKFITKDMVKHNCVVIDVGMNRDENGKLCGDVDFENVSNFVSFITPVPGGVGPMTITMLLNNTLKACKIQNGFK